MGAPQSGGALSSVDRDFVTKAASGAMFEVQSSRVAMEHGELGEMKPFADMMIRDHSQANEQLQDIARRKQIELPTQLLPEHQQLLEQVRTPQGAELARAYHALDVYLVTSRQEGGPKGVLESMATGVPLVTTPVGQAPQLVEHERNGLLVELEDAEAIAAAAARVRDDAALAAALRAGGRETAEANAYERLDGLWAALLGGFVEREGA